MNEALEKAIEAIDQEIEAIEQQRADLIGAREHLAKVAGNTGTPTPARAKKPGRKPPKNSAAARAAAADDTDHGAEILAALKNAGGSMKPGELAKALGLNNLATLRYWLKPLEKAKRVVATGVTAARRISLPGKSARREL
jgi:lambda repressor-like predicted transcriptional regulator